MFNNNTLILNNEMVTYNIIPDFNVSNLKNEVLTSVFSNLYESAMKRISFSNLNFRKQNQVHFNIVLEKQNISFYISFPNKYEELIDSKIKSCWSKCAHDKVNDNSHLKIKTANAVGGELRLTRYNHNPISVDLSDTSQLTSLMQVMRAVTDEDKIVINFALEPMPRLDWLTIVEDEVQCVKQGKEKVIEVNFADVLFKNGLKVTDEIIGLYLEYKLLPFEILLGMVNDSGDAAFNIKDGQKELEKRYGEFDSDSIGMKNRHRMTRSFSKKNSDVFKCKITILSSSQDSSKAKLNLLSVYESFKELNDENEFYLKELKHKSVISRCREMMNQYVDVDKHCILSTKEVAKLIQLPQRKEQRDFKIKALDETESDLPKDILDSNGIPFAYAKKRGKELQTYRSVDKNLLSLVQILVGSQGSGKTSLMKLMVYENYKKNISNLVIDILEDCKISKFCKENIRDEDRIDINISLDNYEEIPSLCFNEISCQITEDMNPFRRISLASNIAEHVELIIDSISDSKNGSLTDAMVRYLYSASMVTFIRPFATLNDVFDVLRIPSKREEAIAYALKSGCFKDDTSIIYTLYQLDKIVEHTEIIGEDENGKPIKRKTSEVVNNDSLIVGINNRITQLEKNPYIKKMLRQKPNPKENFIRYIEENKTIVVSMPQYDFPSEKIRDLIATFYTSRLWLATECRRNNEDANVCTIVLDEVYTIKGTMLFLKNNLTQFRRHRIGLITSSHFLGQFEDTWQTIKSCGASYVLLAGTEKEQVQLLKEELDPFDTSDLLSLKQYHGIFIQKCKNGYAKYIGRVPNIDIKLKETTN